MGSIARRSLRGSGGIGVSCVKESMGVLFSVLSLSVLWHFMRQLWFKEGKLIVTGFCKKHIELWKKQKQTEKFKIAARDEDLKF
ncbi:hypothetical protein SOVF_214500 [Spinacia oleracea]|nr:hypothetical protein SOVF_214500 [Spinacia oleracea]